jgi:3-dehydroquinate dehydratase I
MTASAKPSKVSKLRSPIGPLGRPKIGDVQLGNVPRVVLVVSGDAPALRHAAEHGVDIFELRVDQLRTSDVARVVAEVKLIRKHRLPIIGTVRSAKEGGAGDLSDSKRAALYEAIFPLVDAIDIEVSSVQAIAATVRRARENGNVIILSHHDFSKTPSRAELSHIAATASELGADLTKIATQAHSGADVLTLFGFTAENKRRNLVTIAMGPIGSVSRLILPLAGSLMTYTSMTPSAGQIPFDRLVEDLRFYYPAYHEEFVRRLQLLEYA